MGSLLLYKNTQCNMLTKYSSVGLSFEAAIELIKQEKELNAVKNLVRANKTRNKVINNLSSRDPEQKNGQVNYRGNKQW